MRPAALAAVCLAAVSGCATAGGARPPPPAEPATTLRFAWPDGFQARVTLVHREQRPDAPPASARASHRLVAERRGNAIRVSVRDVEAAGDVPDLEMNVRISEALVQVVAQDGTYLRTEGLDEALAILGAEEGEERGVSRRALERIAELDWELTAGGWAGRALEPGRPSTRQFPGSVPLLPGVPALLDVEQSLLAPAPCEEGGAASECVALSWRGTPTAAARAEALRRLRGEGGAGEGTALEDLDGRVEARLIAEPATLVPHRLDVEEELRIRVRHAGGDAVELVERSEDHYRFVTEQEL